MDDQNKNLILATGLSFLVILVWFFLFPPPEPVVDTSAPAVASATDGTTAPATADAGGVTPEAATAVPDAPRLAIDTPRLAGSISMLGGRIDDLSLKTYRKTVDPTSDSVQLLKPLGEDSAYFVLSGWGPTDSSVAVLDLPNPQTEWTIASGGTLAPGQPVTLRWENGKGLIFTRTLSVDDHFMFSIADSVENKSAAAVSIYPYASISRVGVPKDLQKIFVVHEGAIGRTDGVLTETDYADIADYPVIEDEAAAAEVVKATTDGWVGFTDHYWMTTLIPPQGKPFTSVTKYISGEDTYRTAIRYDAVSVAPGQTSATTTRLFAGAKEWATIRAYQNNGHVSDNGTAAEPIPGFIDSIDWGWFFFLTKPIFAVLHWLHGIIGNMGLAIIGLTFVLKLLVLPLAYKSYVSMARMKELQPELEALKERSGGDKQLMQREMMKLYKEKKVNPAAGCLPILIQIPIFFSLYKVIFVTLELRHSPFFGWLNDLSAPDSSSFYNLFGLLPWAAPTPHTLLATIFIGALPILLGISMWLQQKLNPAPADATQQMIFAWMPWVFMFMLGSFASGLVLYWITNNTITFAQQYLIMRSHGHKPDIFGNIRSSFRKKPAAEVPVAKPKPVSKATPAKKPFVKK
jgi:YidC/Oxa1 family membrane protein insertase